MLPVHALRDRLDNQIAALERFELVLVVPHFDAGRFVLVAQRRRAQFFQILDGAQHNAVLRPVLGRQVEQDHGYPGVDAVGGDLRSHYARAEDRDFPDDKIAHGIPFMQVLAL